MSAVLTCEARGKARRSTNNLTHACSGDAYSNHQIDCEEKRDPSERKPLQPMMADRSWKETYELDLNIRLEKRTSASTSCPSNRGLMDKGLI